MFNIFIFEVKYQYKSTLIWLLVSLLFSILFLSIFQTFSVASIQLVDMLKNLPEALIKGLGMDTKLIGSFNWFYGYILTYLSLILCIFSCRLGLDLFNKEILCKTIDFLMCKPVSRRNLFIQKYMANFVVLSILQLIIIIVNLGLSLYFANNLDLKIFLLLNLANYFLMVSFFNLGIFLKIFQFKIKNINSYAFIVVFSFFLLNFIQNIIDSNIISFFSIFSFFNYNVISETGNFDLNSLILLFLNIIFISFSFYYYTVKYEVKL